MSWFLDYFGLRIVNVSDSESDPAHSDDGILFKFQSFAIVGIFGVFADNEPQLFLRIGVDSLQIDFVLVVQPVAFLGWICFERLLVRDSEDLACFLILFVEIHGVWILNLVDVGILGGNLNNDLFLLGARPAIGILDLDVLLVPQHLGVAARDEQLSLDHLALRIHVVVVEQTERVLWPGSALHLQTDTQTDKSS